jgi:LuxR family maltose regulon positive regulatory protein
VVRLCTLALQVGIELEYVQDLIRKRGLLPDLSAPVPHRWPYPVKVYALGDFALVVDDQPVTFRRKAQRKPLELLKILIAWGGRNIEQARIADVLWPDADGDAAQRSLATTLHRLRRLLSHEQAVYLRDGRLSLDERYCRVDAWSLERQMEQVLTRVRESSETATPVHLASLTNAILCAYRGPFLGQDPESWTLQARNRLRDRYLKCLDEVGAYWEARGDWTAARTCYERSLDVEPTWEGGYRGLMRCHAGMGQTDDVERVYHRCMQALAPRSLVPSPETERALSAARSGLATWSCKGVKSPKNMQGTAKENPR